VVRAIGTTGTITIIMLMVLGRQWQKLPSLALQPLREQQLPPPSQTAHHRRHGAKSW
jgi:hypothetical protein